MLYAPPLARDMQKFVQEARRIEKRMRDGGQIPLGFAMAKLEEIALASLIRETGELTIEIPALPRPTIQELQGKDPWIRRVERDTSMTGPASLVLTSVLRVDETSIDGPTYEARIAPHLDITLGLQHADWFAEYQDEFPLLGALRGKVYIDFPGLVVVSEDGDRRIPYLGSRGERWARHWNWLGYSVDQYGRVAVSGK